MQIYKTLTEQDLASNPEVFKEFVKKQWGGGSTTFGNDYNAYKNISYRGDFLSNYNSNANMYADRFFTGNEGDKEGNFQRVVDAINNSPQNLLSAPKEQLLAAVYKQTQDPAYQGFINTATISKYFPNGVPNTSTLGAAGITTPTTPTNPQGGTTGTSQEGATKTENGITYTYSPDGTWQPVQGGALSSNPQDYYKVKSATGFDIYNKSGQKMTEQQLYGQNAPKPNVEFIPEKASPTINQGYSGPPQGGIDTTKNPVAQNPALGGSGYGTSGTDGIGGTTPEPVTQTPLDFTTTYNKAISDLGVTGIKAQFDSTVKAFNDLNTEQNDKIADINENPWMSQSVKDRTITQIKSRYETRLNTLTNMQSLYDSLYQQGIAEAKYLTTGEMAEQNALLDAAQKSEEAKQKLIQQAIDAKDKSLITLNGGLFDKETKTWIVPPTKSDTQVVEANGRKLLIDSATGKTISDLGSSSSGSSDKLSQEEKDIAAFNKDVANYIDKLDNDPNFKWRTAWDSLHNKYPKASTKAIDEALGLQRRNN